jgi:hypothetical protein
VSGGQPGTVSEVTHHLALHPPTPSPLRRGDVFRSTLTAAHDSTIEELLERFLADPFGTADSELTVLVRIAIESPAQGLCDDDLERES